MTQPADNPIAASDTRPTIAPSRSRRRLLLGATSALPSVLTLSSGAQAAVLSNLRCIQDNSQATPPRFTSSDDGWTRARVDVGQFQGQSAYCITTPGSACKDPIHPQVAAQGSEWVVGGGTVTAGPLSQVTLNNGQQAYALVYIDRHGAITTLDTHDWEMHPVRDSCWASVAGTASSRLG